MIRTTTISPAAMSIIAGVAVRGRKNRVYGVIADDVAADARDAMMAAHGDAAICGPGGISRATVAAAVMAAIARDDDAQAHYAQTCADAAFRDA
jgi:hypothetical protein